MAKKTPVNISIKKSKAIWKEVSPDDWLELLKVLRPDSEWVLAGDTIRGLCPFHTETSKSFNVNLEKGFAYCFGSSCNAYHWDPIQFVAALAQISYTEAIRKLKNRFDIKLQSSFVKNAQQIEDNLRLKKLLLHVMNIELMEALQNPDEPEFAYIKPSIDWLKRRQIPFNVVHRWPVGVVPTVPRLHDRLESEGKEYQTQGFEYLKECFATPGETKFEGSLVFAHATSPTTLGRFRVRRPTKTGHEEIIVHDPYDDEVGVFGLSVFAHLGNKDINDTILYGAEGDMDAFSLIAHQLDADVDDILIIATGGKMESDLDWLLEFGFKEIYLIPDNEEEGEGWCRRIMSKNDGVTRVFNWDKEKASGLKIKDIDAAIRHYGFDEFFERLNDKNSFALNHDWLTETIKEPLERIDPDDVRARTKKAAEFGSAIRDSAQRKVFIEAICQAHGLDKESLLLGISVKGDTPLALSKRWGLKLAQDEYCFMAQDRFSPTLKITAWNRKTRTMCDFAMNSPRSVEAFLVQDLGPLEDYILDHFGQQEFLYYRNSGNRGPVKIPDAQRAKEISRLAFAAVGFGCRNIHSHDTMKVLGQGVHYFPKESRVLVVNGTHFFEGTIHANSVTYEELQEPIYKGHTLALETTPWSRNIKTVDDFSAGLDHNPKEVFEMVKEIMNIGWRFKNNDLTTTFLAADVLYTTIATVFGHVVAVDVHGGSITGKSTLIEILGGESFPDLRLCEATHSQSIYTEAGIRQCMVNGVRLRAFLDEFEDTDSGNRYPGKKAIQVRGILELVRAALFPGGGSAIHGSASGKAVRSRVWFPVTVAGIFPMKETRDLNRFLHLHTVEQKGRTEPQIAIAEKFSSKSMAYLRRGITLCLLPRLHELTKIHQSVQKEFAHSNMQTRLKGNLLPATAILKFLGLDYKKFIQDFYKAMEEDLVSQGATTESEQIWEAILHTTINLAPFDPEKAVGSGSVGELLRDVHRMDLLTKAMKLGVLYMPKKKWLVVHWKKAVPNVLNHSPTFRGIQSAQRLKTMADEHPHAIPKEIIKRDFAKILRPIIGPKIGVKFKPSDLSILKMEDIIDESVSVYTEDVAENDAKREEMLDDLPEEIPIKRGDFDEKT